MITASFLQEFEVEKHKVFYFCSLWFDAMILLSCGAFLISDWAIGMTQWHKWLFIFGYAAAYAAVTLRNIKNRRL